MPIIKFVNEDENIEYAKEQDLCSLLCYAFDLEKQNFRDIDLSAVNRLDFHKSI